MRRGAERFCSRAEQRLGRHERRSGDLRGLAEVFEELCPSWLENAGQLVKAWLMPGAATFEVGEDGRGLFGEAPEAFHRRPELFEERREELEVARERAAVRGGRLRDRVALHDEVGDAFADRGERRERLVGVDRQLREHVVLAGEDAEDLVEFLQRRVGAADDRVEVAAAARRGRRRVR